LPLLFRHLFWRPQVVWVVAPALFCAPGAWLAARLAGAHCWLHIQDFEVDAAFELGLLRGARLRGFALGLERWLLGRFDRVSSVSRRMIEHLHRKGVTADRVVMFQNWVDIEAIQPGNIKVGAGGTAMVPANRYRAELQIAPDAVVALYSGNMGAKQGLELLADAAAKTRSRRDLVWVFCGDGVGRGDLERACVGLPNVRFLELQPVERLGELLGMADIHLLPQRADAADLVMPSKLTGMLASGRPVIATALPGTQVAEVVEQCGLVVPPGDAEALVDAVLSLADDAPGRATLGARARAYAEANLERDAILSRFESELRSLITS
jgi:colanic acid biosynthesis glycosyl transferase WcaI